MNFHMKLNESLIKMNKPIILAMKRGQSSSNTEPLNEPEKPKTLMNFEMVYSKWSFSQSF